MPIVRSGGTCPQGASTRCLESRGAEIGPNRPGLFCTGARSSSGEELGDFGKVGPLRRSRFANAEHAAQYTALVVGSVFGEGGVPHVVQAILDAPMSLPPREQMPGAGLAARHAGHRVLHLERLFDITAYLADQAADLSRIGPIADNRSLDCKRRCSRRPCPSDIMTAIPRVQSPTLGGPKCSAIHHHDPQPAMVPARCIANCRGSR